MYFCGLSYIIVKHRERSARTVSLCLYIRVHRRCRKVQLVFAAESIGASPSGKATDSDSVIRVFKSLRPSQKHYILWFESFSYTIIVLFSCLSALISGAKRPFFMTKKQYFINLGTFLNYSGTFKSCFSP